MRSGCGLRLQLLIKFTPRGSTIPVTAMYQDVKQSKCRPVDEAYPFVIHTPLSGSLVPVNLCTTSVCRP